MPDPMQAVILKTRGSSAVSALVGSRVGVFGDSAASEAGALPYITAQVVAGDDEQHIGGHADIATATVQINCVGATYASAQAVRAAVSTLWRAAVRETIAITGDSFELLSVSIDGFDDRTSTPQAGRDSPRYIASVDLTMKYRTD